MIQNRYYLVQLPPIGNPTRLDQALAKMARLAGKRDRACEIGHFRLSLDGTQAIVQAALDDEERAWLLARSWILDLGAYNAATGEADSAVRDWLTAHLSEWEASL